MRLILYFYTELAVFIMRIFFNFSFLLCSGFLFCQSTSTPKLIVGIVVDQMCYDYLYRYENKLSDKGFLKLLRNGSVCHNTQYNYVPTFTGPGHASIYTGTTPNNHGIIANEWYDRNLNREINCVEDSTVKSVGTDSKYGKSSPKNLLAFTITDQLKLTYKKSKVISVSIKNRSAILPGGHLSDGSYWFDYASGKFITSSYFKMDLPKWVSDFNAEDQVKNYLDQTWKTLLPIDQYTESEMDNSPYEVLLKTKKSPEFPYDLKEMSGGKPSYDLFTGSPFANTYLTDFALKALKEEEMGIDENPDFLAISYSTPDIVGHNFGPYSVEIEDIYLRLDLEIEKLLDVLESSVGKNNFVLFLTADHAVVPVPQYLIDKKLPGGYIFEDKMKADLDKILTTEFGQNLILEISNNQIYVDHKSINKKKIDKQDVLESIESYLMKQKGIKEVYSTKDMTKVSSDNWLKMIQLGYRSFECGDLMLLLEPGYLPKHTNNENTSRGTSHGSAFNYDSHVPLIWYGKQIPVSQIYRHIDIIDIAATLAPILHIQRPNMTTGEPIIKILK